jgi:hypothetical protein
MNRRAFMTGATAMLSLPAVSSMASAQPAPLTIDCRRAPWNIAPAVHAIVSHANRIAAEDSSPLIVLIAETHTYQTHTLLQQAVLKALHDQRAADPQKTFAYGYEKAHNISMERFMNDSFYRQPRYEYSKSLFRYCAEKNISVSFNDVASRIVPPNVVIDQDDEFTRGIILRHRPDLLGQPLMRARAMIYPDQNAMQISNLGIAQKSREDIQRTGAKIYIQHCGGAHAFGVREGGQDHPYRHSLVAKFTEAGTRVLPVLLSYNEIARSLPRDIQGLDSTIKVTHMARGEFGREPYEDVRRRVMRASLLEL